MKLLSCVCSGVGVWRIEYGRKYSKPRESVFPSSHWPTHSHDQNNSNMCLVRVPIASELNEKSLSVAGNYRICTHK